MFPVSLFFYVCGTKWCVFCEDRVESFLTSTLLFCDSLEIHIGFCIP